VDLFVKTVIVRDWDIAAPELILREAGGVLLMSDGNEIVYNNSFEKAGIIATSSETLAMQAVNAIRKYEQVND